jgi:hypothetical protein
MLMIYS